MATKPKQQKREVGEKTINAKDNARFNKKKIIDIVLFVLLFFVLLLYLGSISDEEEGITEEQNNYHLEEDTKNTEKAEKEQMDQNVPSIETIADACWYYGKVHGVPLTDYASEEITKDSSYYMILMWDRSNNVWGCWYNPDTKDVFVEKKSFLWDK